MRVINVRHGESLANYHKDLGAQPGNELLRDQDVPLTSLGHDQALETGRYLREQYENNPDYKGHKLRIYCTPFKRGQQTLDGILKGLGGAVEIELVQEEPRMAEQNFGLLALITDPKVAMERFPVEYKAYQDARKIDRHHARPPGGESRADVVERIAPFAEELMKQAKDPANDKVDVLVIGHGLANRVLEMSLTGKDADWLRKSHNPHNASVRVMDSQGEKGFGNAHYIHQGYTRPQHLPKGYKNLPFGLLLPRALSIV